MRRDVFDRLLEARAGKIPAALATRLDGGDQVLVTADGVVGDTVLATALAEPIKEALVADKSTTIETATGKVFIQVFNPPLRLIVVGAVHIAQPLAPMASLAGYAVTVVDPRRAFATEFRFPNLDVTTEWPDEALERLAPDRRTAVVTLTHDPKLDDAALGVALRSEAFYIGCLGSTRTHAGRLKRLAKAGFSETETARIKGPVGLPIGAKSPAEIAIAIMAQITETLRRPPAEREAAA